MSCSPIYQYSLFPIPHFLPASLVGIAASSPHARPRPFLRCRFFWDIFQMAAAWKHSSPSHQAFGFSLMKKADCSAFFHFASWDFRLSTGSYTRVLPLVVTDPATLLPTRPTDLNKGMAPSPGMLHNTELSCLEPTHDVILPSCRPQWVRRGAATGRDRPPRSASTTCYAANHCPEKHELLTYRF